MNTVPNNIRNIIDEYIYQYYRNLNSAINKLPNDVQQIIGRYIHNSLYWNVLVELHQNTKRIALDFEHYYYCSNIYITIHYIIINCKICNEWHATQNVKYKCSELMPEGHVFQCPVCYDIYYSHRTVLQTHKRISFWKGTCRSCNLNIDPRAIDEYLS
jgi:transcription elongation factor Elf1